ncbi:MAG TPA: DUF1573 domain-containing protein [Candidatus Alistipes avicola]|uniref:DUF1573 domain-containing protein n=1 Tax=Candidatus Alistipes avicola TaxID=2838432 RepID=A0A9D2L5C1_9BACT|nr:DUF1573 domain-containing protein [Candidatus Alistipes avicola]
MKILRAIGWSILFGLMWTGVSAQEYEGAHLKMESAFHNFGDIPRKGGNLVWEFEYTNDGTAPLVIVRTQTTCSCVKVSFPKRPLAPGETATLRVVYEPHKNEPGTFSKVIQIFSNSVTGRELVTVCGNSIDARKL